jgi:uncharacterized protein (TIGR03437 family)
VTAGTAGFTLTVNGNGFVSGSTVQWNGVALQTTLVSATQLTALVGSSLIASSGTSAITVFSPGGLQSNAVTFTINPQAAGALSILTASPLPNGAVGVPYSQALSATGGTTPYKGWAIAGGTPPPGIGLATLGSFLTGLLNGVPTTPGTFTFTAQVTDGSNTVATKQFTLTITGSVSISAKGVVNAASYAGGAVSPGEMITIFGSGLGPSALVGLQLDNRGYVSTSLGGTQVLFDGTAAPLIYTVAGQVSAVVPYSVSGKASTQLQVSYQGQNSNVVAIPVTPVAPGIFTVNASGLGLGAVVNQDGTVNSATNPALVGSYVSVYATGEGQTTPSGVDGKPGGAPAPAPLAQPVTATVGGTNALVQYAGGVSGLVAGVLQVNVQVPQGLPTGNSAPILVSIGGVSSQSGVTIAVKGSGTVNPPAPTLASLSPASAAPGSTVLVTLTGTNFVAGASVAVSNPGVAVSNINVVGANQITATFTISASASAGPANVTVTTPGGTSGPGTFTINGPSIPTLVSISPNSGVPGTTVPVTLTGTNFVVGANVTVSNSSVVVSNVKVVGGTQITGTFTIATTAALGPSNVTVTTTAGTSAAVSFTITSSSSGPTITITPADGATASTSPAITVAYSAAAGLDLKSLSIAIDGIDSTAFFSVTSSTATYSPVLSGGPHLITAGIKTTAGILGQTISHFTVSSFLALPGAIPTSGKAPLAVNFVTNAQYTDGAITRYQWDFNGSGKWDTDEVGPQNHSYTYNTPGVRNAKLQVTNDKGATTSATVQVAVAGSPPTATANATPTNGGVPLTVSFTGRGVPAYAVPANTIVKYEWDFDGDGVFDYSSTTTASSTYTYTKQGTYTAVLRVTDSQGLTAVFSGAATTVRVGPDGSPTASIWSVSGAFGQLPPVNVSFYGQGTSPNGKIVKFEWDFNGDGVYDYSSTAASSFAVADTAYTYTASGPYTAYLRVTDSTGLTGIDSVDINIAGPPLSLSTSTDTLHPQQGDTVDVLTTLSAPSSVTVFIKNQAGQTIRTLANKVQRSAGPYKDTWDAKDDSGNVVGEGLYYAVLQTAGASGAQTLDLSATTGGNQITFDPSLTQNWSTTTADGTACSGYPGCNLSPYTNNVLKVSFQLAKAATMTAGIHLSTDSTQVVSLFTNKVFGRGSYAFYWEGTDAEGHLISPPPNESFGVTLGGFDLPQNAIFVEEAPQFSSVSATPNYLEPFTGSSSSGPGQSTTVSCTLSKQASVALQVFLVDTGALLRTITQPNVSAGAFAIAWDGRADNGMFVAQGNYRLALKAVDAQGNQSIIRYVLVRVFY